MPSTENLFFLYFIATILLTRIVLWLRPTPGPTLHGIRVHHYLIGLFMILVSSIVTSQVIYAIGLALFVDELTFILIGGRTHEDNYSLVSLTGTFALVALVFVLRSHLNLVS